MATTNTQDSTLTRMQASYWINSIAVLYLANILSSTIGIIGFRAFRAVGGSSSFSARQVLPETLALMWTPTQILIPWVVALTCIFIKLPTIWSNRKTIILICGIVTLISTLVYRQSLLKYPLLTAIALVTQVLVIFFSVRLIDEKQK